MGLVEGGGGGREERAEGVGGGKDVAGDAEGLGPGHVRFAVVDEGGGALRVLTYVTLLVRWTVVPFLARVPALGVWA
jgi:hypothetical protein